MKDLIEKMVRQGDVLVAPSRDTEVAGKALPRDADGSLYFVRGLQGAKLYRKSRPDDTDVVMIAVKNSTPEPDGTIKDYMLRIDPRCYAGLASRDCHAAMASTWRNRDNSLYFEKPMDYRPAIES